MCCEVAYIVRSLKNGWDKSESWKITLIWRDPWIFEPQKFGAIRYPYLKQSSPKTIIVRSIILCMGCFLVWDVNNQQTADKRQADIDVMWCHPGSNIRPWHPGWSCWEIVIFVHVLVLCTCVCVPFCPLSCNLFWAHLYDILHHCSGTSFVGRKMAYPFCPKNTQIFKGQLHIGIMFFTFVSADRKRQ